MENVDFHTLSLTVGGHTHVHNSILWTNLAVRPPLIVKPPLVSAGIRKCTDWYVRGNGLIHIFVDGYIGKSHPNWDYYSDLAEGDSKDMDELPFRWILESRLDLTTGFTNNSDRLYNAALKRMNTRKNALATEVGIALVESKETLKLLNDQIKRIVKAVRLAKKAKPLEALTALVGQEEKLSKKRRKALTPLTSFSDIWLELRYGWQPLIYLIEDVLSDLSTNGTLDIKENAANHFRGSAWKASTNRFRISEPIFGSYEIDITDRVGFRCAEWSILKEPRLTADAVKDMILNILKPASTLVEAIPLSFVANWFLPIEDYAKSLNKFPYDEEFLTASVTEFSSIHEITLVPHDDLSSGSLSYQSINNSYFERYVKEEPLSLRFGFSNGLNLERVIDALTLSTGSLRKMSNKRKK